MNERLLLDTIQAMDEICTRFQTEQHPAARLLIRYAQEQRNSLIRLASVPHEADTICTHAEESDDHCGACLRWWLVVNTGPLRKAWSAAKTKETTD